MPKIVMNFTENQGIHWMLMKHYIIYETRNSHLRTKRYFEKNLVWCYKRNITAYYTYSRGTGEWIVLL